MVLGAITTIYPLILCPNTLQINYYIIVQRYTASHYFQKIAASMSMKNQDMYSKNFGIELVSPALLVAFLKTFRRHHQW